MAQKSKAASLTGALLAPKGAAEPASPASKAQNSRADDVEPTAAEIARIGSPSPTGEELQSGGIHFPLRLDPAEHLELRMAAARSGMSCQEIIVEALTRYLADIAVEPDTSGSRPPGRPQ